MEPSINAYQPAANIAEPSLEGPALRKMGFAETWFYRINDMLKSQGRAELDGHGLMIIGNTYTEHRWNRDGLKHKSDDEVTCILMHALGLEFVGS